MLEFSKDTLFYDGSCPLCSNEIRWLRKLSTSLQLVDIHADSPENWETIPERKTAQASFPDKDSLLRTLHLRKANGQWLTGVNANIAAWAHTPIGLLFRLLNLPIINGLTSKFYNYWAKKRYQRLYCQVDSGSDHSRCP